MSRPRSPRAALAVAAAAALALLLRPGPVAPQAPETGPPEPPRVRPQTRLVPQHQWEYLQPPCIPLGEPSAPRREFEEKLNEQGKRGWELVSLMEADYRGPRGCLLATFKRQLSN
jgi:hypothetical protein